MLKPFMKYFGSKYTIAAYYPEPKHKTIIEPFAGSAAYSVRHAEHEVILVEKDPAIALMWRYLIAAEPEDIRKLPLLTAGQSVDDFDIDPGAKVMIGFLLNAGSASPCKTPSKWMIEYAGKSGYWGAGGFWGERYRERIASQVKAIAHWQVIEGDYSAAPDIKATWLIDPPYIGAGKSYRCSAKEIDFTTLGAWCQARPGQVIVCENEGATWLPFVPFRDVEGTHGRYRTGRSKEALYLTESLLATAIDG